MDNNTENRSSKRKRKSSINPISKNDTIDYKTSLNSNISKKNKRNTISVNKNKNYDETRKSENFIDLKDGLTSNNSNFNAKIYNHEKEKILNMKNTSSSEFELKRDSIYINSGISNDDNNNNNLYSTKNKSSIPRHDRIVKNRSKSEYNLSKQNTLNNANNKRIKFCESTEFDKKNVRVKWNDEDLNLNDGTNNFNKNDLKNLEKIIEINNSNSNININPNNSNYNKLEKSIGEENNYVTNNNNINTNTNSTKNIENKQNYTLKHQRMNSTSASIAVANQLRNSRILTNSEFNTSNTEKKSERKTKKMSLISPEHFKNDFIKYENSSKKIMYKNRKSISENVVQENIKTNRNSILSTTSNKKHYSNLKPTNNKNNINSTTNQNLNIYEQTQDKIKSDNNQKYLEENDFRQKYENNYKYAQNYPNNKRSNFNKEVDKNKKNKLNSFDNNYYDNMNFNYKNEFDDEINEKTKSLKLSANSGEDFQVSKNQINDNNEKFKNNKNKKIHFENIVNEKIDLNDQHYKKDITESNFDDEIKNKIENVEYIKTREIKPNSTDKFRDLSPIRESEYSYDLYNRKKESNNERNFHKINNEDNYIQNQISKKKFDSKIDIDQETIIDKEREVNSNHRENILSKKEYLDKRQFDYDSKIKFDDALKKFNNLYEFKNNKNSNFIYDEFQEKILPITNFEGESYPENLYRGDKKHLRENDMINNRSKLNNKIKREEIEYNRNTNNIIKSNEFEKTGSNIKKIKNSNISMSRIKKNKKNDSSFVPWDKVYKDKFKEDFKNEVNLISGKSTKK